MESGKFANSKRRMIQVSGKVRARLQLPRGASLDDVQAAALIDPRIAARLAGHEIRKIVHVPDRLLNIVMS